MVIATSFGEIFAGNAANNGLLNVVLEPEPATRLLALAKTDAFKIDLERQTIVTGSGFQVAFDVNPFDKHCLLKGLDPIVLTLEYQAQIDTHAAGIAARRPWEIPVVDRLSDNEI